MHSNRIEWIDIAKGISIISVVLGHMGNANINRVVFIYHLPVFLILSGYLMKKEQFKVQIKKDFMRLIIPYIFTCVSIILLQVFFALINNESSQTIINTFLLWLKASLYGAGDNWDYPFKIHMIGGIWFLLALFFSKTIINNYIETKFGNIVIFLISFFGWASFNKTGVWLPLSIQAGMLLTIYLLIGYKAKEYNYDFDKLSPVSIVLFSLISVLGVVFFKGIWLVHCYYGNGFMDFIVTICASFLVIKFAHIIEKVGGRLKKVFSVLWQK